MPATVLTIDQAEVRFGPYVDPMDAAAIAALTDFSCQVTRAEITSSSNTTSTTVPATFCQVESSTNTPVASTFTLNLEFLQDWTLANGLSSYLFANDATKQGFALYLDGANEPVATGEFVAQAGGFGGAPGSDPLSSTVTLEIEGYPTINDPAGVSIR